ncbi:MAG: Uncharacterized protein family (UPF0104) [Rhodobacteraceae bacterium HLUCCA08]|nr:MAG: Uncharacterized protein family (UPF0104) [Rhodobacteraceae bacterium HLUCCA08]
MTDPTRQQIASGARTVALVIAASALLSIFAPQIVDGLGLAPRFTILLTLFALAGFIWALVVTWKLWQKTRDEQD